MLSASPVPEAEEYAIHDYDNIAQGIAEHGRVFALYAEWG